MSKCMRDDEAEVVLDREATSTVYTQSGHEYNGRKGEGEGSLRRNAVLRTTKTIVRFLRAMCPGCSQH